MELFLAAGALFFILFLLKFYIYKRFLRDFSLFKDKKWPAIALLGILGLGEILFFVAEAVLFLTKEPLLTPTQHIFVSFSLVLTYCFFMACICSDILKNILHFAIHHSNKKQVVTQPNAELSVSASAQGTLTDRRKFLKKILDYGVAILFVCFSIKSIYNALSIPPVKQVRIKIKGLRRQKTIAMVSDVHVGKTLGKNFLQKVVDKINAMNPDIIVIVGDLVDEQIANIKDELEPLRSLKSTEGIYYVVGNHEYYHGVDSIVEYLETLNLKTLHNTNIELADFNLVGVSDLAGFKFKHLEPDLERAKQGLNPSKPNILLAHQPKFVRRNDVSEFDLILCGHTHAGQVFPLSFFVWLDQHYVHGLYTIPHTKQIPQANETPRTTQLYVSSGVGFWGPAVRFLAPSEIVQVELETQD